MELCAWRTILDPGEDDRDRRARAAGRASRDVPARKAIPESAVSMARAASRGRRENLARKVNREYRGSVASRDRKAGPVRPANCLRSNR
jgi:hypothetical protein